MKKRTIIIGNGFDLNLGLPKSYKDFIESDMFKSILETNDLAKFIRYNYKRNENWVDLELLLKKYAIEVKKEFFNDYEELKNALFDYIEKVSSYDIKEECSAKEKIIRYLCDTIYDNYRIVILNFNYTDSIFRFYGNSLFSNIMKINNLINGDNFPLNIIHVHGSISERSIILGIEDDAEIPEEFNYIKKAYDRHFINYTNYLLECDELIVFGHSLGASDESFFKPFFLQQLSNKTKCKKIIIYYKGEKGYKEILHRIDNLTGLRIALLRKNNILQFKEVDEPYSILENITFFCKFANQMLHTYNTLSEFIKNPKQYMKQIPNKS